MLEYKIYVCKLGGIKLLKWNLERPVNVEFSPEQEKAMICALGIKGW